MKWKDYAHKYDTWEPEVTLPPTVVAMYDPNASDKLHQTKISRKRKNKDLRKNEYLVEHQRDIITKEGCNIKEIIPVWLTAKEIEPEIMKQYIGSRRKKKDK